jgi:hypothetical protein
LKLKRLFTVFLVLALMVVASPSVFAKYGWGDGIEDAIRLEAEPGQIAQFTQIIESIADTDYYVIDNSNGEKFNYSVSLESPPGLNFDFQLVIMNPFGQVVQIITPNENGPGAREQVGATIGAGYKVYVRVFSHGTGDFSPTAYYILKYERFRGH